MVVRTQHLPRPKSYEDAAQGFARVMAQPRLMRTYFAAGMLATSLLSVGLLALNFRTQALQRERLVVRIDDVGRAQAVGYSSLEYKPQSAEIKYFLTQFVHDYYGRDRATVRDTFTRSMAFLSSPLAAARMAPYVAQIDIEKVFRTRDGAEIRREKYVESVTFSFTTEVPNALIPVNPLGLMITYLREDQAF